MIAAIATRSKTSTLTSYVQHFAVGLIIGVALSVGGAAALLIAIALSIELLFVAASTAGSTRTGGGSLGLQPLC